MSLILVIKEKSQHISHCLLCQNLKKKTFSLLFQSERSFTLGSIAPDPNPNPTTEPNTQGDNHRSCSADPSHYSPLPSLTAFASVRASPEAEWEDDVPGADSENHDTAADPEEKAEWVAAFKAAAAELKDEAKWEEAAAAAESEEGAGDDVDTGGPDSPPRGWPSNSARRDPRKAELFRRLDTACEARRLQESRLLKRPPPPAGAGDPDEPIWPMKSRHWRRLRELTATQSSLANPELNPNENSESIPPSNKSNEMLSAKVADQGDDTSHSSKSASDQIVTSKKRKYSIDTYVVQCGKCWKWRLIPTKIQYDKIRENSRLVPFLCEHVHGWKPGVSCDDPEDISQDDGFWVIDRPCISQTPLGWERTISIRSEGCSKFADVYYKPPKGRKLRSTTDFENYLQDKPDCAVGIQPTKDWFQVPEYLQVYLKRCHRQSKHLEPNEVLPLSSAPPIHEDLAANCVLALYDKGQYCMQGDMPASEGSGRPLPSAIFCCFNFLYALYVYTLARSLP